MKKVLRKFSKQLFKTKKPYSAPDLLKNIYGAENKSEFEENLKKLNLFLEEDQPNSYEDRLNLDIIDYQLQDILYGYIADIPTSTLFLTMKNAYSFNMIQTLIFFEFFISRTKFLTEINFEKKVEILRILAKNNNVLNKGSKVDHLSLAEKIFVELTIELKQNLIKKTVSLELIIELLGLKETHFFELNLSFFELEIIKNEELIQQKFREENNYEVLVNLLNLKN